MANTNYEFIYTVEDYSGVSIGVVIPAGQTRWFDTVTGHDATEVIQLTGDGAASVATLLSRHDNITVPGDKDFTGSISFTGDYDVIDTDSADVAATTPTSPVDGQIWTVVNSGSSGNHVTGLPGTISLGDGRRIDFVYDTTNTTWRYEDVIIDEYTASDQNVTKWSGGKMTITSSQAYITACNTSSGSLYRTDLTSMASTYVVAFTATPTSTCALLSGTTANISVRLGASASNTSSDIAFAGYRTASSASETFNIRWSADGRWKS